MGAGAKYKCSNCGDVIQSMHRHDYVSCSCYNQSEELINTLEMLISDKATGALEDGSGGLMLTIGSHALGCALTDILQRGITVDGGDSYLHSSGNPIPLEDEDE